jgi:hypothetical protein
VTYAGVGSLAYPFQWTRDQETALDAPGAAPLINAPAMQLGLYDMQGFDPFQLQDYNDFMSVLNGAETDDRFAVMRTSGAQSPLLNMLNVRYIVVDARLPADRLDVVAIARGRPVAFRNDQVIIYENTAALPHAWLVHDVRQADGMNGAQAFAAGTLDPRVTATVDGAPPAVAAAPRTTPDQAAVTEYQPDYLAVTVKASANGFLVLSDVYADGWKATVDGKEARIYRANGALRGVAVPAGEHTVQFTYAPAALKLGLAITGVTGLGMIAVFALALIGLWFDYRARVERWYRGPLVPRRLERNPAVAILPRGEGRRLSWRGARILRRPPPP